MLSKVFLTPRNLNEMILPESLRKQLEIIPKVKGIHLIHSEKNGTGKTLSAKLVAKATCQTVMFIDCYCKQSLQNIDNIEKKLSVYQLENTYPVIVIDEVNHLTPQHFQTLTALYNNYYGENDFIIIMTANNIDKIPNDLISRVHEIDFNKNISPDLILDYIEKIIDKHSKKPDLNEKFINDLISSNRGNDIDIRKAFMLSERFLAIENQ